MDENLEWLTQNTEDPKSNKRNLTFPTHTVNVIELQSNKKVATTPFLHQLPLLRFIPLSSKIFCNPPSDSIFGRSYPPAFNKGVGWGGGGGGEGSNYDMSILNYYTDRSSQCKYSLK